MAKKKLFARISKAVFNGLAVGTFGGAAIYIGTTALNMLAGTTVLDPIAMTLLTIGGILTGAIGLELSKDLDEE